MLRDLLNNHSFNRGCSSDVKKMMDNLAIHISQHINSLVESENLVIVNTTNNSFVAVPPIAIRTTSKKTDLQLAAEQLAKQQGIEIDPLYFDDMEASYVDAGVYLVGSEFKYHIDPVDPSGDIKVIMNAVVYHRPSENYVNENHGVKVELFISSKQQLRMKQNTITLVGCYTEIIEELKKKYSKFITEYFEGDK